MGPLVVSPDDAGGWVATDKSLQSTTSVKDYKIVRPATRRCWSELRAALLRYCKLDTEAMVRLAHYLAGDQKKSSVA